MMKKSAFLFSLLLISVLLAFAGVRFFQAHDPLATQRQDAPANVLMADDKGFAKAYSPRPFEFPADHGAHPDYRTEWWYFTGNLKDASGRPFGYQLTFFRFALAAQTTSSESAWRNRQMYMAHFTVTDIQGNAFYHDERFSRAGLDLAGAEAEPFRVWLNDWSAEGSGQTIFPLKLTAKNSTVAIDLQLTMEKPVVLQGNQGLSQKSEQAGNASYYYSFTRLATAGSIRIKNQPFSVSGTSWMDREWSTSALSVEQAGWDWFSLQLSDHSEIMFYRLRRKDGKADTFSSGIIVEADNSQIRLSAASVTIDVSKQWTSPHSQSTYPAKWRLTIPEQAISLDITPFINDQELNGRYRYWEGAVKLTGEKNGRPISGQGYVELTGY
ncbi:lipocalin-like domain-containing protein [Methylicorpusculum sp.]|uniref:lipocalin-like domain-containing protein n=1 Tax=Methylicorpusculum sp. TaxID=2713644 RepID=UPI002728DB96|nr:lipocalin-like domain-containing protein [Methylicorpusculum sp.]MDO8844531.1 lipocalin-like domain-containing protein [Methylicorpusculum sp.]